MKQLQTPAVYETTPVDSSTSTPPALSILYSPKPLLPRLCVCVNHLLLSLFDHPLVKERKQNY